MSNIVEMRPATVLPDWLPVALKDEFNLRWSGLCAKSRNQFIEILNEQKLKTLWTQLQRRNNDGFLFPANYEIINRRHGNLVDPSQAPLSRNGVQGIAIIIICTFIRRLKNYKIKSIIISKDDLISSIQRDLTAVHVLAEKSKEYAAIFERYVGGWVESEDRGKQEEYNRIRELVGATCNLVSILIDDVSHKVRHINSITSNRRHNDHALSIAFYASNAMNDLFGQPFYNQAIVISEFITGENVSLEQLRFVFKSRQFLLFDPTGRV